MCGCAGCSQLGGRPARHRHHPPPARPAHALRACMLGDALFSLSACLMTYTQPTGAHAKPSSHSLTTLRLQSFACVPHLVLSRPEEIESRQARLPSSAFRNAGQRQACCRVCRMHVLGMPAAHHTLRRPQRPVCCPRPVVRMSPPWYCCQCHRCQARRPGTSAPTHRSA